MNKKIRVLQVVSSLGLGGYERVVMNLCQGINHSRFEMSVCCLKHASILGKKLADEGSKIHVLSSDNMSLKKYFAFIKLRKLVLNNNIDIIHTHGQAALMDGTLSTLFSRNVATVHTFHFGNYPHLPMRYLGMEGISCRFSDQLVAVSEDQKDKLIRTYRLKQDRLKIIWNGVEEKHEKIDSEQMKHQLGIPKNAQVVGTIGNLIEQKGYPYFLETCKLINTVLPDTFFIIIGGGHLEHDLKHKARILGLGERVIFTGFRSDATDILQIYDIFFLASLWEAMPIVLLEAMAAGKPIVATDVGENSKIVSEGESGFIVQAKDVGAMAQRIELLLIDKKKRNDMGNKAKERFRLLFTSRAMVAKYENLYESMLKY